MARKFYLSFVNDLNGYDRYDMVSKDSLQELDEIVSNFKNRNEVIAAYLNEYNIDEKRGKVCIVYEDTLIKEKELKSYGYPSEHSKKDIDRLYTYAHTIPIMYSDKRLMKLDTCLQVLKYKLFNPNVIIAITQDLISKKRQIISINKKYIFETEEEKDLVNNESKYKEALELFYKRLNKSSLEDKYFYCRVLAKICNLFIKEKKKVTNLKINNQKLKSIQKNIQLTESEQLEIESEDMDSFYINHDLDEVIRLSPNSNKPIGSEGKKIR